MLSQKRPHNAPTRSDEEENSNNSSAQPNQSLQNQAQDVQSDSDGSSALSIGNKDEFITVALADIRKEVQCPICLGIIRKTRTVMECLHRFCRECIDKSMRLGNNECPACRTHCASRRSLRDDPNYDALISALYPDIDKYEEEELAFHEEERARNKQIQASIAQTLRRQSEALGKKRSSARATAAAYARRSQVYRSYRGRRNQRTNEQQGSDEDEANDYERGKDSSSADEQVTEVKPKRNKRWGGSRFCQNSLAAGSADGGDENDSEANRDSLGASAGLVGNSEMLAWGRGGIRSSTRHGNQSAGNGKKASAGNGGKKVSAGNGGKKASAGNGKNARNIRLPKLIDANQNTVQNDVLDIHLTLVPLDEQRIPSLQCPHICCNPTASIGHLCQYVGLKTDVIAEEVEIMLVKGFHSKSDPTVTPSVSISRTIDPCKDEMHILEEHETLAELQAIYNLKRQDLLFAYRQKLSASMNSV